MPISADCEKRVEALSVVEIISKPAGTVNDDRAGYAGNCLWVLDGATDCTPEKYLPGNSDAAWLAGKFDRALSSRAANFSGSLTGLIEEVTTDVRAGFERERLRDLQDRGHQPSAAALIARLKDGILETAGLGDCQLFLAQPGERPRLAGVDRSRLGDRHAIARIQNAMQEHQIGFLEARAKLQPSGNLGRRAMNQPGGYSVLSIDMAPLELIHRESIPLEPGARLLFASDGFTRLYEVFGFYKEESLLEAAFEKGLAQLVTELRELESKDEGCERFPRIKPRDDATAILVIAR